MSTKLPEVADLDESEGLGHKQDRDHNAKKKRIVVDHADKRHQAAEKMHTSRRTCVTGEEEG